MKPDLSPYLQRPSGRITYPGKKALLVPAPVATAAASLASPAQQPEGASAEDNKEGQSALQLSWILSLWQPAHRPGGDEEPRERFPLPRVLLSESLFPEYHQGLHLPPLSASGINSRTRERKEGESRRPRVQLPAHMEPTFFIGGGNGNAMIAEVLTGIGWKRTQDKLDDNYRMKWVEIKSQINYNTFKEGDQMANHIPNCNLLTNKLGLLNSLQEYDRVCQAVKKRSLKLDFMPETYRLDDPRDRDLFLETYKEGEIWINKPTGRNQGKGIYLIRNMDEIKAAITEKEEDKEADPSKPKKPLNRIVQRYIHNPLLLEKKKFDIRAYMLVANTVPFLLLYHKGYVRLSLQDYDTDTDNLVSHLTNQFIQKKDPSYKDAKEDTVWSMDRFNTYINEKVAEEKGIEQDWVYNTFTSRMKQIMTYCFTAVKHRLNRKIGYFDLYGLDFMIDEDMKVWLIEVNVNPCLSTNCQALKEVLPDMVKETLYVSIECFEKSRKGRPLMPLQHLHNFQILYNGSSKVAGNGRGNNTSSPSRQYGPSPAQRSHSISPVRRTRSLSPQKEAPESKFGGRSGPQRTVLKSTPTVYPGTGPRQATSSSTAASKAAGTPIRDQGQPTQKANAAQQKSSTPQNQSTKAGEPKAATPQNTTSTSSQKPTTSQNTTSTASQKPVTSQNTTSTASQKPTTTQKPVTSQNTSTAPQKPTTSQKPMTSQNTTSTASQKSVTSGAAPQKLAGVERLSKSPYTSSADNSAVTLKMTHSAKKSQKSRQVPTETEITAPPGGDKNKLDAGGHDVRSTTATPRSKAPLASKSGEVSPKTNQKTTESRTQIAAPKRDAAKTTEKSEDRTAATKEKTVLKEKPGLKDRGKSAKDVPKTRENSVNNSKSSRGS